MHAAPRQRSRGRASTLVVVAHMALGLALAFLARAKVPAARVVPPFLAVMLFAGTAFGAVPEICGDTVRGKAHHNCTGTDGDRDGFHTDGSGRGWDCDDANMWIYEGVWNDGTGCSAGQAKLCGASNTYGSCQTPAEGTRNYYIDCDGGNDTTGTGASGAPWKTFKYVAKYYSTTPAGWVDIAPDDFIYAAGECDALYSYNNNGIDDTHLFLRGPGHSGTVTEPIVFSQWYGMPQWHMIGQGTSGASINPIYLLQVSFIKILGVEISGGYGDAILNEESEEIYIENANIHDVSCSQPNNCAGVKFTGGSYATGGYGRVRNSVIFDVYDPSPAVFLAGGSNAIIAFKNGGLESAWNVFGYTSAPGTNPSTGDCDKWKHGASSTTAADSSIHDNVYLNCYNAIISGQSNLTVYNNRSLGGGTFLNLLDVGGDTFIGPFEAYNNYADGVPLNYKPTDQWNTNGTQAADYCSGNDAPGMVELRDNVFNVNYAGNLLTIGNFEPDGLFTQIVTGGLISFSDNCYYNPADSDGGFNLFASNNGDTSCSGTARGNSGQTYTSLATWQAAGYDSGSAMVDPNEDADHVTQEPSCAGRGFQLDAGAGPTPTPSPTPTPAPTPTPLPNSGRGYVFAQ